MPSRRKEHRKTRIVTKGRYRYSATRLPVSLAQMTPPNTGESRTCAVSDPFILRPFWEYRDETLDAYLVALAAFQRGLRVSFHFEVTRDCERFSRLPRQGGMAELFSVSDGRRTHYFRRAQGDGTSLQASRIMDHKPSTKQLLTRYGISVPEGEVIQAGDLERARLFCRQHPGKQFLIKPIAGTLGRDVHRNLSAEQVLGHLEDVDEAVLLEVFYAGNEYRVHVIGGQYIGAITRLPAGVMGDGRQTVKELVESRNQLRQAHPLYRHMMIEIDDAFLQSQQLSQHMVPRVGEWISLGSIPKNSAGGESPIRTYALGEQARRVAVQVQLALAAPNVGIDLIVCDEGTTRERVIVLEANQCPFQTALMAPLEASPGMGNHTAEALIDTYFPASRLAPRWPAASFDFVALRAGLSAGNVGSIALPVLQPHWQHQRLSLDEHEQSQVDWHRRINAMRHLGLWVQTMVLPTGARLIDVLGPATTVAEGWKAWPALVGDRCDP